MTLSQLLRRFLLFFFFSLLLVFFKFSYAFLALLTLTLTLSGFTASTFAALVGVLFSVLLPLPFFDDLILMLPTAAAAAARLVSIAAVGVPFTPFPSTPVTFLLDDGLLVRARLNAVCADTPLLSPVFGCGGNRGVREPEPQKMRGGSLGGGRKYNKRMVKKKKKKNGLV